METVKVSQYFKRIGLEMPENIVPDSDLLFKIHYAHCVTVPYENLDILRGIPLSLDPMDLFDKVVTQGKGGFCFELNGLLAWFLRELGYEVTEYAARYLRGEKEIPMRRHRVLRVKGCDGRTWCCDVGIGETSERWPVEMIEGLEQLQFGETYRFDRDPFLGWVLLDLYKGEWKPFYAFTEEPQLIQDFIAPTFYCEKHPDSPFTSQEMFSLKTEEGRICLDGNVYREFVHEVVTLKKELTDAEMPEAYRKFGLEWA